MGGSRFEKGDFNPFDKELERRKNNPFQQRFDEMNAKQGSTLSLQNDVSKGKTPQDRLTILRRRHPDAAMDSQGGYIYTDHTGSKRTLNAEGADLGDIAASNPGRMGMEMIGGAIGGGIALIAGQMGPQALTPEELVTVPTAYGIGAAMGGELFDIGGKIFDDVPDTRGIDQHFIDAGIDFVSNAVGLRAGDMLGNLMKEFKVGGRIAGDEIMNAFKGMGIEIHLPGVISNSKFWAGIEGALSQAPLTTDMISGKYADLLSEMGNYASKTAATLTSTEGRDQAGAQVIRGVDSFVNRFSQQATELYDQIPIQKTEIIATPNFLSALGKVDQEFAANPAFKELFSSPFMTKMKDAMVKENGSITYGTLKAIRTQVGGKINTMNLMGDAEMGELKMLYGALSQDLEAAAYHGGFGTQFTRANNYWKAGRSRIDDMLQPVVNKAKHSDVYKAVMSGSKDGAQTLRTLKRSLPMDKWNAVVAQHVRELGRAKSGFQDEGGELFSASTFMTNFNTLNKEARDVLFTGIEYKGLEKSINLLVKASRGIKDTSKMANNSNTAQRQVYFSLITGSIGAGGFNAGGIGGAAVAVGGSLLAPVVIAKLITSPSFVKWLAAGAKVAPDNMSQHFGRLTAIAASDESMRAPIEQYINSVMGNLK